MSILHETESDAAQARRHRVLIAAAVAAIFGDRVRIAQIELVAESVAGEWIRKGRHAMHVSHNLTAVGRSMQYKRTETR